MDPLSFIFVITILIISVIAHELAHGYAALWFGDPTARLAGRLTLNPLAHLDLVGSFIVPVLTFFGGFIIGWAKPVPYNPHNLGGSKYVEAFVAGAGPLTNVFIALVFSALIQLNIAFSFFPVQFHELLLIVVYVNLILAVINLIPVPPIDGSKVLSSLLPFHLHQRYLRFQAFIQNLGFFGLLAILFLILFVFGRYLFFAILWLTALFTGLPLSQIIAAITGFF